MYEANFQHIYPLLGKNHRETMDKVSSVLAFISRGMQIRIDAKSLTCSNSSLDDFNEDELNGLVLICQTLIQALAYEPPPKAGFG